MFRDRGEEQIIYVRPDNESVDAKRERIEKYIPIDIGKVLGRGNHFCSENLTPFKS